ncbi:MAG: glutaredoxin family protein [Pseudomonadota bacterium]
MTELTLYTRRACPLCDEMMLDLELALRGRPMTFRTVDIDSSARLVETYGLRIPVLCHGDDVLCEGRFEAATLTALPGYGA